MSQRAIEKRWTAPEELTLIDLVLSHEEELFGSLKGPVSSSTGRTEQRRSAIWQEVAVTLNSRFTYAKRDPGKLKKKFHNIKQRAKEKIDEGKKRRTETGGGPPPPMPTPAEEALLKETGDRPGMRGLNGIDTDAPIISVGGISSQQKSSVNQLEDSNSCHHSSSSTSNANKQKTKKRKLNEVYEATLRNIELDNERLQGAKEIQEQKLKTLKSEQAAFDSLNLYLTLKLNSEFNISFNSED